jgi:5-methyltetrahydrofolate--homocysteine methyltransferase
MYEGEVRYARDAFEGLSLMDTIMAVKRGEPGAVLPELRQRRVRTVARPAQTAPQDIPARSDVATDVPVPSPPFWGDRIVRGIALAEYTPYIDERALFLGQWGLKASRGDGPSYADLVAHEGRPRLRMWLDRIKTESMIEPAVAYGYFPAVSEGDELVILWHEGPQSGSERARLRFPRQRRDRHLVPVRLLPATRVRRSRRGRLSRGHHGPCRLGRDRATIRRGCLP